MFRVVQADSPVLLLSFIILLDDDDLKTMVSQMQNESSVSGDHPYLRQRYDRFVL